MGLVLPLVEVVMAAVAVKILCDGSTVTWEPVMVDDHCYECGHVTGQHDTAEPYFHGPDRWDGNRVFCSRCGVEYAGLGAANAILRRRIAGAISKSLEDTNRFLSFIKGTNR